MHYLHVVINYYKNQVIYNFFYSLKLDLGEKVAVSGGPGRCFYAPSAPAPRPCPCRPIFFMRPRFDACGFLIPATPRRPCS